MSEFIIRLAAGSGSKTRTALVATLAQASSFSPPPTT
jgi:hypothetical protein